MHFLHLFPYWRRATRLISTTLAWFLFRLSQEMLRDPTTPPVARFAVYVFDLFTILPGEFGVSSSNQKIVGGVSQVGTLRIHAAQMGSIACIRY